MATRGEPTISARVPKHTFRQVTVMAEKMKISRSALMRKMCADMTSNQYAMKHGGALDKGVIDFSKIEIEREMIDVLVSVGAGTAAGYLGYKMAKWVRTEYTDNDNEGVELVIGVLMGALAFVGALNYMSKPKK